MTNRQNVKNFVSPGFAAPASSQSWGSHLDMMHKAIHLNAGTNVKLQP